ncbi:hypothetical protein TWF481_011975 [Arthrobotrys musiformis]|uniref:Uncharacterized protein n=1 Tax=Arthrobotrys musiformis TaxID=47236 RepID=A0AAV9VXN5_9PEZI
MAGFITATSSSSSSFSSSASFSSSHLDRLNILTIFVFYPDQNQFHLDKNRFHLDILGSMDFEVSPSRKYSVSSPPFEVEFGSCVFDINVDIAEARDYKIIIGKKECHSWKGRYMAGTGPGI